MRHVAPLNAAPHLAARGVPPPTTSGCTAGERKVMPKCRLRKAAQQNFNILKTGVKFAVCPILHPFQMFRKNGGHFQSPAAKEVRIPSPRLVFAGTCAALGVKVNKEAPGAALAPKIPMAWFPDPSDLHSWSSLPHFLLLLHV